MSAFAPETMAADSVQGLNTALIYGLSLIVGAVGLALVYMWLRRGAGSRKGDSRL
jgi:hypothetical protein